MSGITATALVKAYPNGVRGVDQVDLTIADGEFFALLGPSGCGKTTLLRAIAGLEAITEGTLEIGGRDVTHAEPGSRGVAMVFQDYALFPHMDVGDNIAYPLRIRGVGRDARRATASEAADSLSLRGLLERLPSQLSGGQQQRVALARAVAIRPQVLLLDEPLSNLDARLRLEARTFLKQLQRDLGVTTVFVTHDQAEALALADRIAVMKQGRLQQVGSPRDVFLKPANTFVAGFIGSLPMNLIDTVVGAAGVEVGGRTLPLPADAEGLTREEQAVIWAIRPEYLRWSDTPEAMSIEATVSVVENLGATVLATVTAGAHRLQVSIAEECEPAVGDRGYVTPLQRKALLFDRESTARIGTSA